MYKNTERLTPFSCLTSLYDAYIIHLRIYLHDCICPNYSYLLKSNMLFCFHFIILVSCFLLSMYHLVNQNGVYPTAIALNNNNYSTTTTATATTNNHHHHYPAAQLQTQATYASIPTASIVTPSNNNNSYNSPYNNNTNTTTATTMNPTYSQQKSYQPSTAGVNTAYPAYNASPNVVANGTFVYPAFGTNNATSSTSATAASITTTNTASSSSSQNLSVLNSLNYLGVNANVKSDETKKAELMDQVTMRLYEVMDQKNRKLRDEMDFEFSTTSYLDSSTKNIADKKICKLLMMVLMIRIVMMMMMMSIVIYVYLFIHQSIVVLII